MDAIVIDFAKAFDVVPHDILILKLIDAKIDRRVIAWISEFLRDRNQKVRIGQHLSEKVTLLPESLRAVSLAHCYFLSL